MNGLKKRVVLALLILPAVLTLYSCGTGILKDTPPGDSKTREVIREAEELLFRGKNDEAMEVLEAGMNKNGEEVSTMLLTGKLYFFKEDYQKAEELFKKVLKTDSRSQAGTKWLARTHIFQGRGEEAGELLLSALTDDPEDPELLILLGKARRLTGDFRGAIQSYSAAHLFSEYLAESYLDTADMYRAYGLQEEMMISLKRAEKLLDSGHPLSEPIRSLLESKGDKEQ